MTMPAKATQAEVVVVGAGPGGLNAALTAAKAGARVTLVDNYQQPGGQYYRQPAAELAVRPDNHQREGKVLWQKVVAAGVEVLTGTTVWSVFEDKQLALHGDGAPHTIQAQAIILATGAYERTTAFPGWTLPGVMTPGAVQVLLKSQGILPGQRIVLAGTGPLQLVVAASLVRAGAEVVAIVEGSPLLRKTLRRPLFHTAALWGQWSRLAEGLGSWMALQRSGVPVHTGWGIVAAHGEEQVTGVTIAQLDNQWRPIPDTSQTLACDTLCCGYGFVPATELARLLGVRFEWRPKLGGFVPVRDQTMQTSEPGIFAVGDCAGIGGAGLSLIEGQIAGLAAVAQLEATGSTRRNVTAVTETIKRLTPALRREQRFQQLYGELFTPGPGLDELSRDDTVICRCEGVTRKQIVDAVRMGGDTLESVKGLTRDGMGNCQGRVCGHLVATLVAQETGKTPAEVGQFRVRPPIFPMPLEALNPAIDQVFAEQKHEGVA